ncbi:hypothetical protein ADUPG1_006016 [Aduncisulcus paluster]|uniref:Uncharacterized protein n=1 Tax=Aduncisulcus paluster TaxID=2918883 RepID=A0ABQ5KGJ9_9EUKA|nr:hypothetical protein ADUPG1_006016 [Aduncisulcus paluster]
MTEKYKSDIKILQEKLKEKIKECNISASQHKEELGTISKRISILERQLADEQSLFETYKSQEKSRIHITLQKERDTFKKNETARRKRWVESKTKELRISIAQTYKDKIEEIVRDHKKELLAKDTKYAEEIFHLKEELKDQYSLQIDEARRDSSTRAAAEVSEREGEKIRNLERLLDQTKEDLMRVKLESEAELQKEKIRWREQESERKESQSKQKETSEREYERRITFEIERWKGKLDALETRKNEEFAQEMRRFEAQAARWKDIIAKKAASKVEQYKKQITTEALNIKRSVFEMCVKEMMIKVKREQESELKAMKGEKDDYSIALQHANEEISGLKRQLRTEKEMNARSMHREEATIQSLRESLSNTESRNAELSQEVLKLSRMVGEEQRKFASVKKKIEDKYIRIQSECDEKALLFDREIDRVKREHSVESENSKKRYDSLVQEYEKKFEFTTKKVTEVLKKKDMVIAQLKRELDSLRGELGMLGDGFDGI